MKKHRYLLSVGVGLVKGLLVATIIVINSLPYESTVVDQLNMVTKTKAASLSSEFGVNGAVSSLQGDSTKQSAVNKMASGGFGWTRDEFNYSDTIDFTPYDAAHNLANVSGIKTLGLLSYPGSGKTHDQWKSFVSSVVTHYGSGISAWEIMNEADVYLSASDYTVYLKEAYDIIKANNSGATIVLSGLTSRIEATDFWNGVAVAGGWGYFDNIGLHIYHNGSPEKVNFGGGDLVGEIDRVVGNINKNGGGKNIWITEIGYKSSVDGDENQSNWLARTLAMAKSVSKVSKLFIYRLYDNGDGYGLLNSDLIEKTAFGRVKDTISALSGQSSGTKLSPQQRTTLDNFDSVSSKWDTKPSSNSATTLSLVTGYKGNGMKIEYNFSADSAYSIAEQTITVSGNPTALSAWFYGDNTKNIWKFRFKDKNGETFQTDLGSISSGWSYKQFSIGTDTAWVSWDGNGVIDFPISFNAFVADRQSGGTASASGIVDELTAIIGSADLYAYQYGTMIGYWKASGSDTATLCGASRIFTEVPQYIDNVDCSETPVATVAQGQSSTKSSSSPTSSPVKKTTNPTTSIPKVVADKTKSYIRLDGSNIVADGTSTYKIVIGIKDANDKFISGKVPSITLTSGQATIKNVLLIGPEWLAEVTSTEAGEKSVLITSDSIELGTLKIIFIAVPIPVITETPEATPSATISTATGNASLKESNPLVYSMVGIGSGIVILIIGLLLRRFILIKSL